MTSLLLALCCAFLFVSSSARKPLFRAARDADKTGRYIVMLEDDVDHEEFQRILRQAAHLSTDERPYGVVETVEKAFALRLNAIGLEKIRSHALFPRVNHVEEEQMAYGSQDPSLPWHLDRIDQKIGNLLDHQYNPQNTGEGVDVYVLDTGINYDHEEFERRAKYGGYDAVDDYYDDDPPQKGRDCHGHGTHVSSLAGGKTFGTAKKVNLYSVRVLDCHNFAPWSVVLAGMDYVAKRIVEKKRPMVVVMSLGGAYQPAANEAIKKLSQLGAIVVVAAGNGKTDACGTSPASSEYAITVGATNRTDDLYWKGSGTNYGKCVDIFAPGESILGANHTCTNCTKLLSGTSMATPMVAGIAAMYLQDQPLLNMSDVKKKLQNESVTDAIDFASLVNDEAKATTTNIFVQAQGGCGGVYRYRTHYNITSPDYPNDYPQSQVCEWKIIGEPGQEIAVTMLDIDLEQEYDYLLICDGEVCQYDNIKAKYTGNITTLMKNSSIDLSLRSSSEYLTILLHTDLDGGGRGFMATFTKFYKGTPLVVKDYGLYLPSALSLPGPGKYSAHVEEEIGITADVAEEIVSNWSSRGYEISWTDVRMDQRKGVWLYDFLFQNSSIQRSKGYVEINDTELQKLVEVEKANDLIIEIVTARINKGDVLYAIVFKEHSHLVESYSFTGIGLYELVITRDRLIEAGWKMVCQHLLPMADVIKVSAVFHRDKRQRYGIKEGLDELKTLSYYGLNFYQFTTITLVLGLQNYYPRYVSSYNKDDEVDSRLSVIYEERVAGSTFFNWFRWGRNDTEVTRDVSFFSDSWSPVILCGYVYNNDVSYMVVWGVKLK